MFRLYWILIGRDYNIVFLVSLEDVVFWAAVKIMISGL